MAFYDLSSHRPGRVIGGKLIFSQRANRDVRLLEGFGHAENAPDKIVRGFAKTSQGVLPEFDFIAYPGGNVDVHVPRGYELKQGRILEFWTEDTGEYAGLEGVSISIKGEIREGQVSSKYDLTGFNPGILKEDQAIIKCLLPRGARYDGVEGNFETPPKNPRAEFDILKNERMVGSATIDKSGNVDHAFSGGNAIEVEAGDIIEVRTLPWYSDIGMKDLSLTLTGETVS